MKSTGIFFGSSTGNTEGIVEKLADQLGATAHNVDSAKGSDMDSYENIIFATSTWGAGDLQDDFEDFISEIESANFDGKKIALLGVGDSGSYPDTFVDAIGTLYTTLKEKGAEVVGQVSTEGYDYEESTAVVDNMFVGLALDEDNEADQTDDRLSQWIEVLKEKFN